MSNLFTLEAFVFSKQSEENVLSALNLFKGVSLSGETFARVQLLAPTERKGMDLDYSMVLDAFAAASPDSYVIVCKDTSVSPSTSSTIMDVIEATIKSGLTPGNSWDLFYLSKWLDRCDMYSNVREVGSRGVKLVDTVSPNGIQCIMFSPQGRAKFLAAFNPKTNPITDRPLGQVLNSRIGSRTAPGVGDDLPEDMRSFYATTCTPSLVYFDVTKRTKDSELLKTVECRDLPHVGSPKSKPSGNMSFFWFIVVVIVAILLVWALYKIITHMNIKSVLSVSNPVQTPVA